MKYATVRKGRPTRYGSALCSLAVGIAIAAGSFGPGQFRASAQQDPKKKPPINDLVFQTTVDYLVTFYPLWFTFQQSANHHNRLVGPLRVSPLYQAVVAINVDTIYVSAYPDLEAEPV